MNRGDGITVVINGVVNRCRAGVLSPSSEHGDVPIPNPAGSGFLVTTHFVLQELNHFVCFRRTGFPLDTGVDVFRVFTENHHISQFRLFYGLGVPA